MNVIRMTFPSISFDDTEEYLPMKPIQSIKVLLQSTLYIARTATAKPIRWFLKQSACRTPCTLSNSVMRISSFLPFPNLNRGNNGWSSGSTIELKVAGDLSILKVSLFNHNYETYTFYRIFSFLEYHSSSSYFDSFGFSLEIQHYCPRNQWLENARLWRSSRLEHHLQWSNLTYDCYYNLLP